MFQRCLNTVRKSINVQDLKKIEAEVKKRIQQLEGIHPSKETIQKANKNIFLL